MKELNESMSEEEMFNYKPKDPQGKIDRVGIPNGLYTCHIEKCSIPPRRQEWYDNEVAERCKKVEDEAFEIDSITKQRTGKFNKDWDEARLKNELEYAKSSVATHEFKWKCVIVDDKPGKPNDDGSETSVRGQALYPTANFVKTTSKNAKIVKLIYYMEGNNYKITDFNVCKTWENHFAQLKVVNSASGFPKATFESPLLKGEDLEAAEIKLQKTRDYLASKAKSEDEKSSSSNSKGNVDSAIVEKVLRAITKFSELDEIGANVKSMYQFFEVQEIDREEVNKAIEQLKAEGKVFEPKSNYLKNVS